MSGNIEALRITGKTGKAFLNTFLIVFYSEENLLFIIANLFCHSLYF